MLKVILAYHYSKSIKTAYLIVPVIMSSRKYCYTAVWFQIYVNGNGFIPRRVII